MSPAPGPLSGAAGRRFPALYNQLETVGPFYLFEFMDLPWLPESLRTTVREVLEICLGEPPRQYYDWVVRELLERAQREGIRTIVELGAGTAPLSHRLGAIQKQTGGGITIEVSDLYPDVPLYQSLEKQFPGVIRGRIQPLDFSRPLEFQPATLLALSGSFHHIPPGRRGAVLESLSGHRVAIFEPLQRNLPSLLTALGGVIPGLMTPFFYLRKRSTGHARRMFWCWLVPLAPLIIVWDGLVSCLRCWTEAEWRHAFGETNLREPKTLAFRTEALSHWIFW
ncbi:MAG: hypothetical protein ABI759_24740 [Candidatus Solibacter sp.]